MAFLVILDFTKVSLISFKNLEKHELLFDISEDSIWLNLQNIESDSLG